MGRAFSKHKQLFKLLFQRIIMAPLVNKGTRGLLASAVGPLEDRAVCLCGSREVQGAQCLRLFYLF